VEGDLSSELLSSYPVRTHFCEFCAASMLLLLCYNNVCYFSAGYTPWAIKRRATFIFTITLANVDRFQ